MSRSEAGISARTLVHLLKSCPLQQPHTSASAASALSSLQHLVCLLEQYYHPSNTGEGGGGQRVNNVGQCCRCERCVRSG